MIVFLRFMGVLTAAVWLGAVGFNTFVTGPAMGSKAAQSLFGPAFFPYFSVATAQILTSWYFHFAALCAFVAIAHLLAQNLYLGRRTNRWWLSLLLGLFAMNLLGSTWLNPKLMELNRAQHARDATPQHRAMAAASFRVWQGVFHAVNVLMFAGVTAYLWHAGNPTESHRFVSPGKFRS